MKILTFNLLFFLSIGDHIYEQIKVLGSSCDWSRKGFYDG